MVVLHDGKERGNNHDNNNVDNDDDDDCGGDNYNNSYDDGHNNGNDDDDEINNVCDISLRTNNAFMFVCFSKLAMTAVGGFFTGFFVCLLLCILLVNVWHFCLKKRCINRRPRRGLPAFEHRSSGAI